MLWAIICHLKVNNNKKKKDKTIEWEELLVLEVVFTIVNPFLKIFF